MNGERARNREAWRHIVEEAKAHPGLKRHLEEEDRFFFSLYKVGWVSELVLRTAMKAKLYHFAFALRESRGQNIPVFIILVFFLSSLLLRD